MTRFHGLKYGVACLLIATFAQAQASGSSPSADAATDTPKAPRSATLLRELNSSLETLVAKVSPAVVQIMVSGYGPVEDHGHTDRTVLSREHAVGSGIIVDSEGYIITNAHVVNGAQRIRVILPPAPTESPLELQPIHAGQIFDATIVGTHKDSDLALLKIQATHLPTLPLSTRAQVRQGELVFAVGSPEGLQDSVTMGVVSSVSRQPDPDNPMVYIQTDAAMNPGNSGGPLVDIEGNLIGVNTLILSTGGGSEGLGFATPAAIVNFDYQHLRKTGHVQRVALSARAQNITPTMAAGLGLARSWGAIVSDVLPGGLADAGGLKIGDIVLAIDDRRILSLPEFMTALYLHPADQVMKVDVLRGTNRMSFNIPVTVYHDTVEQLSDIPDLQKILVPTLNIFVADLDGRVKPWLHDSRSDSGIVVLAQTTGPGSLHTTLETGDIIRAVDRIPVESISQLQTLVHDLRSGDPVVLQIERSGKLQFLAFEME
jgi:serine protease Do